MGSGSGERGGSAGRSTAHSKGLFSNIWLWRAVAGVLTAAVILISCIQFVNSSPTKDSPVCPPLDLCPSGWLYFQRKCYYLSEKEASWNSSQSHCSSHSASLLVIENHQELSFMMKITKQDPWIGLYKRNEEFFWVNGKALDNELFEVKGSGNCAYLESKGVSASGCYLTRKWALCAGMGGEVGLSGGLPVPHEYRVIQTLKVSFDPEEANFPGRNIPIKFPEKEE